MSAKASNEEVVFEAAILRAEIEERRMAVERELSEAECIDCGDTGWRVVGGQEVPCLCEAREPDYRDDFGGAS